MDSSIGTVGGFKEVIFEVSGEDVYGILKYESGVHRVQRVPQTETQGGFTHQGNSYGSSRSRRI